MSGVEKRELPQSALLQTYLQSNAYTDCYAITIDKRVSLDDYVLAFYTTWLFRIERVILKLVSKPSTDDDARRLVAGKQQHFAAWTVEDRNDNQLLMCDYRGRTRSWFMTEPIDNGTRLYFGSAVVPASPHDPDIGAGFSLLLGFHKLYSRALLSAARSNL